MRLLEARAEFPIPRRGFAVQRLAFEETCEGANEGRLVDAIWRIPRGESRQDARASGCPWLAGGAGRETCIRAEEVDLFGWGRDWTIVNSS
jgi:hypothetical protein